MGYSEEMKKIEARKLDMTQIFTEDGRVHPVTVVSFEEFPADLALGTAVKVVGTSKGKGFSGVMKRHGFAGMPATHGRSTKGRAPGSIGGTTTPGRVYLGKRMAGRMGGERVTVPGLQVLEINPEGKTVKVSGPLPGPRLGRIWIEYEPQEAISQESVVSSEEAESKPEETRAETPEAASSEQNAGGETKEAKEETKKEENNAG